MADRYQQLVNTPIGRIVTKQVGLPSPVTLERYQPGQPLISGPVLVGAARGGRLSEVAETAPHMRRGPQAMADSTNGTFGAE